MGKEVMHDDFDKAGDSGRRAMDALNSAVNFFGQGIKKKLESSLGAARDKLKSVHEGAVATTSRGIESAVNTGNRVVNGIQGVHEQAVGNVVAAAENVRDTKNAAVDSATRVARGVGEVARFAGDATISGVKSVHASVVDKTSRYIVEPTANAGDRLAQGAKRRYEGAVATTSRGIESAVNTGNRVVNGIQGVHEQAVGNVVAAAENVRDKTNQAGEAIQGTAGVIADVYNRGANPERYADENKAPNKPVASVGKGGERTNKES